MSTLLILGLVLSTAQGLGANPTTGAFPPLTSFYVQLQGTLKTPAVRVQDLDLEDNERTGMIRTLKAQGKKVICYFSAGTYEDWRSDAGKFLASDLGNALADWPGERWLNIRSANVRSIMLKRMDRAVAAGCDAIDPDNLDGYQNANGLKLTEAEQIEYLTWLASAAHNRGLAIGLKNALNIIQKGDLASKYDFALNESCYDYQECSLLEPFVSQGKAVFILQYNNTDTKYCANAKANKFSMAVYNLALDGKKFSACP